VLAELVADICAGVAPESVALALHIAVADVVAATAARVRRLTGLGRVAFGGRFSIPDMG
jgi:hypothetical protein